MERLLRVGMRKSLIQTGQVELGRKRGVGNMELETENMVV